MELSLRSKLDELLVREQFLQLLLEFSDFYFVLPSLASFPFEFLDLYVLLDQLLKVIDDYFLILHQCFVDNSVRRTVLKHDIVEELVLVRLNNVLIIVFQNGVCLTKHLVSGFLSSVLEHIGG